MKPIRVVMTTLVSIGEQFFSQDFILPSVVGDSRLAAEVDPQVVVKVAWQQAAAHPQEAAVKDHPHAQTDGARLGDNGTRSVARGEGCKHNAGRFAVRTVDHNRLPPQWHPGESNPFPCHTRPARHARTKTGGPRRT